jgi:hypothetical protein
MGPTSFNISIQTDFWTRYRAMRALSHRLWTVWLVYAIAIMAPAGWLIEGWVHGTDRSPPGTLDPLNLLPVFGVVVFVFVLLPLLQMYQLWAVGRRNRTLVGVHHYAFAPEGFSARSELFQVSLKWDAILKAVETKRFFFIYISNRAAHFIPKAQISSYPELEQLRAVLKTYLGDRARLRADGLK